jgi:hypothetical protein
MISTLLRLLLIGFTFKLAAQGPASWQSGERAKLLEGVSTIPKIGAPGPIAIWGNLAFPVISAAEGKEAELALVAAAGYAKGRIILFGHNGYLEGDNAGSGSLGKLLTNCVRWAGNKEKPTIGVKGSDLAAFLNSQGFKAEKIDGALDKKSLQGLDVVVANAQGLTSEAEGVALQEFVKAGGGFIAGMTGWAYEQTSGGKVLSLTHGVNLKALMPAGLAFTDGSAFGNATLREFAARTDLPALMNASAAIGAITKQREGGAAVSPEDLKQGVAAIQLALAAQPPERSALQTAVLSALGPGGSAVPTKEAPLTQTTHAAERIRLGMETRVLRLATGDQIKAHPAAATFPGQPAADAPRVTKSVTPDPTIPGWHSTGLYAVAGEKISVQVPASLVSKGWSIRIGCHTDTLYHLESWSRAPEISRSFGIDAAEMKISSAFGGLLYVVAPDRASDSAEAPTVNIAGAVEAPFFLLGRDTDDTWNQQLKNHPAPWAEFASSKMVLSVPSAVARKVTNPTALMEFWDRVVTDQDSIANQTAERKKPERMTADLQISAGFMHSGYPIMLHLPEAEEMVTYGRIKFPGWGYYHEIGHNHQRGPFTFEGTGEVTNNVFGLYNYTQTLKKEMLIGHTAIAPDKLKEYITAARQAKDSAEKWQLWKANPFHALTTYIQLIEGFGWEPYRQYIASFADPTYGPVPKNDEEKRDQFLVRMSKITQKNLAPFFAFWGIPVSSKAVDEVSKLAPWMPQGL